MLYIEIDYMTIVYMHLYTALQSLYTNTLRWRWYVWTLYGITTTIQSPLAPHDTITILRWRCSECCISPLAYWDCHCCWGPHISTPTGATLAAPLHRANIRTAHISFSPSNRIYANYSFICAPCSIFLGRCFSDFSYMRGAATPISIPQRTIPHSQIVLRQESTRTVLPTIPNPMSHPTNDIIFMNNK